MGTDLDINTVQDFRQLLDVYQARYDAGIRSGEFLPFVYPFETLGSLALIIFILISQRRYPLIRHLKVPLFVFIVAFEAHTIRRCKSLNFALGYGIGLVVAWGVYWSSMLLIFNDPQQDFHRIERKGWLGAESIEDRKTPDDSHRRLSSTDTQANDTTRRRPKEGNNDTVVNGKGSQTASAVNSYFWQSFPEESFRQRMDWIADLISNFRGMGWNYQIYGLSGAPKDVQEQVNQTSKDALTAENPIGRGPTGNYRYLDRRTLLQKKLVVMAMFYMSLDLVKLVMMADPHFWGRQNSAPPAHYPQLLHDSPLLLRYFRLIVGLIGVYAALQFIYTLAPLFFVGLVGTERIGVRAEPWMYPDMFGEFRIILDKGLAGWWGGWWHQIFRYAFATPSAYILKRYEISPKSLPAKTLQLFVAFVLSGLVHSCGSYTQLATTRPFNGPFAFFCLQGVGITLQTLITEGLKKIGVLDRVPKNIRRIGNFVYVFSWLRYTSPMLLDDFARGGVWLFEPVPISPLRALGFGLKGESWWRWSGTWVRWHRGEHWWDSGFAL